MKKILSLALLLIIVTLALALTSCECKHKKTTVLPAVEPTCTSEGLTEGQQCVDCGAIIVPQETVKKLAHTQSAKITIVEPTKYDRGTYCICCVVCGEIIVDDGIIYELGSEGLKFVKKGDGYEVEAGTCTDTEIYIPDGYDGKKIIGIAANGFKDYGVMTSIRLPESITSIGNSAFENCASLSSIDLPDKLDTIGASAFKGCESLLTVEIPTTVKKISASTFEGCTSLDNILLSSTINTIEKAAFKNCVSLTSIEIEGSLTTISESVFEGCTSLENITIPANVKSIGANAFKGCVLLRDFVIPQGVNSFGKSAFEGCRNAFDQLIFIDGTTIGDNAFKGCNSVAYVEFLGKIPAYSYSDLVNLSEIVINHGETEIRDEEFINCASLKWITIPDSVLTIGKNAFYGCDSLICDTTDWYGNEYLSNYRILIDVNDSIESFVLPDETLIIYSEAFNDCDQLIDVVIHEDVINIGYGAFKGCSALESITVPYIGTTPDNAKTNNDKTKAESVFGAIFGSESYDGGYAVGQHMENEMWTICYIPAALKNVTVLSGKITTNAFRNCHSIEYVKLGSDVSEICNYAFFYCTSLLNVDLTDATAIKTIGKLAFNSCYMLESVVIPASVKSIGENAFAYCVSLFKVEFENGTSIKNLANGLFSGCSSLVDIVIPDTVDTIGRSTFANCTSLESIVIHSGIRTINAGAFYGCKALENVEFEVVEGWFRALLDSATYGDNFVKTDIADANKVAQYLRDTYYNFVWKR